MERVVATAIIGGKSYQLVPKTISVQNEINKLAELSGEVEKGLKGYEELIPLQLDFIRKIAGCHIYDGISMEDIDIDDLTIACIAILNGYKKKVNQAKMQGIASALSGFNLSEKKNKGKKKK